MKTTIDLPNSAFEHAATLAAAQGISVEQLLANTVQEKLRSSSLPGARTPPPWMMGFGAFGKTPTDREETRRIQELIDDEFERIEPEDRQ